jgi:hypothetical protein
LHQHIHNYIGLMPDQTIKHNNAAPEFLLILIPVAFLAVFLAAAWKFILGFALLLTGNNVWQSYQWTKLAQQVDPTFSKLIIEQKGEVSPVELSARAKIAPSVANRYLNNKAVDLGGVSYQAANGQQIYGFLTVGTLASALAEVESESSLYQKLAELEPARDQKAVQFEPTPAVQTVSAPIAPPQVDRPEIITVQPVTPAVQTVNAPVAPPQVDQPEIVTVQPIALEQSAAAAVVEVTAKTPAPKVEPVATTPVVPDLEIAAKNTAPKKPAAKVATTPAQAAPQTPTTQSVEVTPAPATAAAPEASDFTQALRNIFNNPPASVPEEPAAATTTTTTKKAEAESGAAAPASDLEIISQVDLAKRLDVHASTIYKRRSDLSFVEWTRNRDPEGVAWGYSRDTKEFYRVG